MNISLRQFEIFAETAKFLSYTKAAKSLHMTQPAVSMQIKLMEETLGFKLFDKSARQIRLTPEGEAALVICNECLGQLSHLQHIKGNIASSGLINVCISSAIQDMAISWLGQFKSMYPNIQLHIDVANFDSQREKMEKNLCDLFLIGETVGLAPGWQPSTVSRLKIAEFPIGLIVPAQHRLCAFDHLAHHQVQDETFIIGEQYAYTRYLVENYFANKNHRRLEINNNYSCMLAVEAGLGIALLSLSMAQDAIDSNRVHQITIHDIPTHGSIYLAKLKAKNLTPSAKLLEDFLLNNSIA